MAGRAALQECLVIVNALKVRRCQKNVLSSSNTTAALVCDAARPETLSERVSARSSPREANLLARWRDRALDIKYGVEHHARGCIR
jgi:hypothetical protein